MSQDMIKTLIAGNPSFKKEFPHNNSEILEVAEFFMNSIQGEGINTGHPSAFLRLKHCSLSCSWCDTQEVWRYGNPYTFNELFKLMEDAGLINALEHGQHLILTGGSPLKQQRALIRFIYEFIKKYGFKPYIEIENECTIQPWDMILQYVDCWNNSPKLSNSGNLDIVRYQPNILKFLSSLVDNSWFKFVITNPNDWKEIQTDFLDKNLIKKDQIILMPEGATREELTKSRELVVNMAVENGVRYCDRLHVILWNKKTGV